MMITNYKTITAYIRLSNEENTIIPCLESIRGIFDEILIIYSNISDRSLDLIDKYITTQQINNISIHKYLYDVLPPHSKQYVTGQFNFVNSLAAYYNFGIQFVNTELLMKIDADQIYFKDTLKNLVKESCKTLGKNNAIACKGHNCIVHNNKILLQSKQPLNGGSDHFIIHTDNTNFIQAEYWELLSTQRETKFYCDYKPYWFHMKDGHWFKDQFVHGDQYDPESLVAFDSDLVSQYESHVLPLLINSNSPYKDLIYQ